MTYEFSLQTMGLIVGLALLVAHVFALAKPRITQDFLKRLPRDRKWGMGLLTVALLWTLYLVLTVDFGEFNKYRLMMLFVVPLLYVGTIKYLDDFLAVRALGILALLAAEPVLDSAFLPETPAKLLLTLLAYAWILIGLFYVGMPYLLRDQIAWVTRAGARWKGAAAAGAVYGALILGCALVIY